MKFLKGTPKGMSVLRVTKRFRVIFWSRPFKGRRMGFGHAGNLFVGAIPFVTIHIHKKAAS